MRVSLEQAELSVPAVMQDPSIALIVLEIALREESTKNER